MKPAPEYDDLGGGLCCWESYDPANKVDLHASAVRAGGGLFFIDPIPLDADALDTSDRNTPLPAGIILTNANHARAADAFRRTFRAAGVDARGRGGGDRPHRGRRRSPPAGGPVFDGALEAIPLPGAVAGEIALYRRRTEAAAG